MALALRDTKKTGGTYPRVTLGLGLTARLMDITPDLAAQWLKKNPRVQRNMSQAAVDMITRLINGGDWYVNGATIVFGSDGRLYDGQHRLAACIKSGKIITCLCIWGVDAMAFTTMDTGRVRTGTDALKANKIAYTSAVSAAVTVLWKLDRGLSADISHRIEKISPLEVARYVETHPGLVDAASLASPCCKIVHSASVPTACYYLFARIDAAKCSEFFAHLVTGADLSPGSPILTLRNKALTRELKSGELLRYFFAAWNAFRAGKPMPRNVPLSGPLPELT